MRILNWHVADMYIWTIALLGIVIAVSAYTMRTIPYSLLLAVAVSAILEFAISKFYLKRKAAIPFSGIITGMIIGAVAPILGSPLIVTTAAVVAILSKFFIKVRHVNVFNPATLGLVVALAAFGVGDQWWAASNYNIYGMAISLTLILVIAAYKARRWIISASFIATVFAFTLIYGGLAHLSAYSIVTALLGINFLFAFVMIAEPKTTPSGKYTQVAVGVFVAVVYAALAIYSVEYPLLVALLAGNVIYTAYKLLER